MRRNLIRALGVAGLLGGAAAAQEHAGHDTTAMATTPSSEGYLAANEKMMADMAFPLTGDADVDFARSMIAHHEGAIAMALVELEHGADPALRKLAEAVIAAQQAEIAFLRDWLVANGQ